MKKTILFIALILSVQTMIAQTRIIAHRGYWRHKESAQNSLKGLQMAADAKLYGSEFDVIITADGRLVVHHDDSINGMRIEKVPYDQIRDTELKNGEKMPTLEQYLELAQKLPNIKLILEIKPHLSIENEDLAAKKCVEMIRKYHMQKRVDYISFSLNICERLRHYDSEAAIAYLEGDMTPAEIAARKLSGIDYHFNILKAHPEWINEAHRLGLTVNVWTVNTSAYIKEMAKMGVDFITTDIPCDALKYIN